MPHKCPASLSVGFRSNSRKLTHKTKVIYITNLSRRRAVTEEGTHSTLLANLKNKKVVGNFLLFCPSVLVRLAEDAEGNVSVLVYPIYL